MLGGYPKIWIRSPNTAGENTQTFKSEAQLTKEETKCPLKTAHASKVVNPFTRALTPPFIGRRRDFYIPKIPSNLRNIPNVNMYMNVLYIPWFAGLISYIYKPATSSHIKPGLLRRRLDLASYWFMNLLFMVIFVCHNLRTWTLVDSRIT
jgi:hypothetical protein